MLAQTGVGIQLTIYYIFINFFLYSFIGWCAEVAFAALIPAHGNVGDIINPTAEQLNQEIARLSGLLSKSDTLYNMPLAVNFAFATVLVPSIAGALAVKDYKEASSKINYSLLISILDHSTSDPAK